MNKLTQFVQAVGEDIRNLFAKHQDTGWRKVTSGALSKGYILVRRVGNMCFINIGGGAFDTCEIAAAYRGRNVFSLWDVPVGFQSNNSLLVNVTRDGYSPAGTLVLTGKKERNNLQMRAVPSDMYTLIRPQQLVYLTDDPFPTTEIGLAAS